MPRTKIFSLPKLRSRSRSVASKKRNDAGGQHQQLDDGPPPQQGSRNNAASQPMEMALRTASPRGRQAAAVTPTNKKSAPQSHSSSAQPPNAAAVVSPEHNQHTSTPSRPSNNSPAPSPARTHNSARSNNSSNTTFDDAHFTSAFVRSPPSFDKFDSVLLSDDGNVFPTTQPLQESSIQHPVMLGGNERGVNSPIDCNLLNITGGSFHNSYSYSVDADEDNNEFMGGRQEQKKQVYPQEIQEDISQDMGGSHEVIEWGESSVVAAPTEENKGWSFDNTFAKSATDWGANEARKSKNPRVVSPSPSSNSKAQQSSLNDDLAAWGTSKEFNETDNLFGANFFATGFGDDTSNDKKSTNKTNVKDDDDGFGNVDDSFFINATDATWLDVTSSTIVSNTQQTSRSNESDPWGGTSLVDASFEQDLRQSSSSFNYSTSNAGGETEDRQLSSLNGSQILSLEENHNANPGAGAVRKPQVFWNDQGGDMGISLDQQRSNGVAVHPLKQQQPTLPTTTSMERRISQGSHTVSTLSNTSKQQHQQQHGRSFANGNHHRTNSNGSSSSKLSKHSQQQPQKQQVVQQLPSAIRHHHTNKRSGGSVGSNSSAVDQILEHYRQKRLAKSGGSAQAGAGGAWVHPGSQFREAGGSSRSPGSSSVISGMSQVSNGTTPNNGSFVRGASNGSSGPKVGATTSNHPSTALISATATNRHHRRIPSGGSQASREHRRISSNGSSTSRHRRSYDPPVSASHNALSSASSVASGRSNRGQGATTPTGTTAAVLRKKSPSPSLLGKYCPPNTKNGYVGCSIGGLEDDDDIADQFLMANIEATFGPRGVAPDMESLSGRQQQHQQQHHSPPQSLPPALMRRSSNGSQHQNGSSGNIRRRSPTRNKRCSQSRHRSDVSVDSRTSRASNLSRASRNSFRTYASTKSALTSMSKETQSVANDLFRLEAQLAEQVSRQEQGQQRQLEEDERSVRSSSVVVTQQHVVESITYSTSGELSAATSKLGAEPAPRPTQPFQVIAPPGKLGIILSNKRKSLSQGGQITATSTHVSGVRSESVLAGKVHVGDVFVSIDGEDVSHLSSKEITSIMARKSDFERVLKFRPLVASGY